MQLPENRKEDPHSHPTAGLQLPHVHQADSDLFLNKGEDWLGLVVMGCDLPLVWPWVVAQAERV